LDGLAFLRPLYYDFPLEDFAYKALTPCGKFSQYMLGNSLMIAPIVTPAD